MAFDKHLGELASRVREAARWKKGALTIFKKLQNSAARAAGMGGVKADHQEVTVGQVAGVEFFNAIDPSKANAKALETLALMRSSIGATDAYPTKVLRDRRRAFEASLEGIETCARVHAAAEEFYSPENFLQMLRWANEHGATQARYVTEGGVVREQGRQGGITISPPPVIEIELLDLVSDYRRAD